MRHYIYIALILLICMESCAYRWHVLKDANGGKHVLRMDKWYNLRNRQKFRSPFKLHRENKTFEKYAGTIQPDTAHNSYFIQFDTVRVYLFETKEVYRQIFSQGLLSGQMLYCGIHASCEPLPESHSTDMQGNEIKRNIWGWMGHTIRVSGFEEITGVHHKSNQRRFKFYLVPGKIGRTVRHVFFLELTNKSANRRTSLDAFIAGSTVTFLKEAWAEL